MLQLVSFTLFSGIYIRFLYRVYTLERNIWERDRVKLWYHDWRTLATALAISCVGILVSVWSDWHTILARLTHVLGTIWLQGCRTLSRLSRLSRYEGGILLCARYLSSRCRHFRVCPVLARAVHQR